MSRIYDINDFTIDSFIHGTIEKLTYDSEKRIFTIVYSYLNLKKGGCLYECKISVSDWWDLSVIEKGKKINKEYPKDAIPTDIEEIIEYDYDGSTLTFQALGFLDIDTIIYYKFIKPKIELTGEYDPD